ncbi:unnamed protein product [Blumeria hordei]|uniref:SigF-like NTF2-like domain-containing protein n=1 Tax=Blumeria hordei TaxID=2867405 RepID=A0A383ULY5_BLUHO|nr:unnamed protein product [Blumeria hordei]
MEKPDLEIAHVILQLTEGAPRDQELALQRYFLPDAGLIHPLCRVPRFRDLPLPLLGLVDSRWVIGMIYRWYKILSPRVSAQVQRVVYDDKAAHLYCEVQQIFSPVFLPFYHASSHLTVKLQLQRDGPDGKYYIVTQEDLYQSTELVRFFGPGYSTLVFFLQLLVSYACVMGALLLAPITWLEQMTAEKSEQVNGVKIP